MSATAARVAAGPRTCEHLEPLERTLAAAGAPVGVGRRCPHDADWGTWFAADAAFVDAAGLHRRLGLDPCVTYEEYEGRLAADDADATFYCARCKRAIVARHPGHATGHVTRVR